MKVQGLGKAAATLALIWMASAASAIPAYLEEFQKAYAVKDGSPLAGAQCGVCHVKPPRRNPYGDAVHDVLEAQKTETLTVALIKQLDPKDADGDGWSNGDEAQAGTLPGDPNSKPEGTPPGSEKPPATTAVPTGTAPAAAGGELVPRHSFHPVVIHFPIALFMFGALLEILGWRSRRDSLREAGYWNLLAGAVSTVLVVPTGFIAALRLGYELGPGKPVFIHLALAVLSTVAMIAVVLYRRKSVPTSAPYFIGLLLATALVAAAGHFGGGLVYG